MIFASAAIADLMRYCELLYSCRTAYFNCSVSCLFRFGDFSALRHLLRLDLNLMEMMLDQRFIGTCRQGFFPCPQELYRSLWVVEHYCFGLCSFIQLKSFLFLSFACLENYLAKQHLFDWILLYTTCQVLAIPNCTGTGTEFETT